MAKRAFIDGLARAEALVGEPGEILKLDAEIAREDTRLRAWLRTLDRTTIFITEGP